MPKYVLDSGIDYDFSLLAISSRESDYQLCIHLNRMLGIELERYSPIELKNKSMKTPLAFSCFMFEDDEDEENRYVLLANRSINDISLAGKPVGLSLFDDEAAQDMKGFLIPELLQTDYLLLLHTNNHESLAAEITAKLKKLKFVQAVQNIDPETLPSKTNLIV
ncbi:MAG: IPExxxVDY family protein [Bacteroidia bacterium]